MGYALAPLDSRNGRSASTAVARDWQNGDNESMAPAASVVGKTFGHRKGGYGYVLVRQWITTRALPSGSNVPRSRNN